MRRRLLELAGNPAFAQSPERQLKLAERSVSLVMEAVARRQWDQALALAASAWRFEPLAHLAPRMPADDRRLMLVAWWTSCDGYVWPWRKQVLGWLRESGYIGSLPRPAETTTIYRGGNSAHRLGLSWGTDPDIARHFAGAGGLSSGYLYSAVAPPSAFLAGFEGLGLPAYVVNPRLLSNVSNVGKVRAGTLGR